MTSIHRQTIAEIDLGRLRSNVRELRALVDPSAFFCPMVKANAYGHGAVECARAIRAERVTHLGVALIEEGLELRAAGDKGDVLVFGLFQDQDNAKALLDARLTPVLSERGELETLAAAASGGARTKIHFKFNTGMNRLGFAVGEAKSLRQWLDVNPSFALEGICTHLLRGDDAGSSTGDSRAQLQMFQEAMSAFAGLDFRVHALNSGAIAALAREPSAAREQSPAPAPLGARPGIAIYGAQPATSPELAVPIGAVMKLRSQLVMINRVSPGGKVSYNATWTAKRESVIGVVAAGYADGYRRSLSNRGSVLCRGRRVPVVGTVCMDYFMVDLTDIAGEIAKGHHAAKRELVPGEEVVLLGEQGPERITAEELAAAAGTISYEIFTGIGSRVPRLFVGAEK